MKATECSLYTKTCDNKNTITYNLQEMYFVIDNFGTWDKTIFCEGAFKSIKCVPVYRFIQYDI